MRPTDTKEVESLFKNLDGDKAPGIDGLNGAFLKKIGDCIVDPLTTIYNLSLATGRFPEVWKTAIVKPIYKGTGLRNVPDSYRPIALLSTFAKMLETIVNHRLTRYLESKQLLEERQFGFRTGKSTDGAVSLLTTKVANHLDKSRPCIGVFLDLAKAFDTVSAPILVKKLESFGIRGTPLEWFGSYLTGRKQCVKVGDYFSAPKEIRFGVPQGSILGPTLFIAYMNDIHKIEAKDIDIICYADDTVLISHGSNWTEAAGNAEKGMAAAHNWLIKNLLTLNVKKTKFVCFHKTSASAPSPQMSVKLHSCGAVANNCSCGCLDRTEKIKYLGVYIDQNLNFGHQITALCGRVRKIATIMRALRSVAPPEVLKMTYLALCQSLLTYCLSSWGGAAKTRMLRVERAQRCVLKVMMKRPRRYPTTELYREAKVLSVRKLFVLSATLSAHSKIRLSGEYQDMLKRRVIKVPLPERKTTFGQRFSPYLPIHIYNNVIKLCPLKHCSISESKIKLRSWLAELTYESTEELLTHLH